MPQDQQHLEGYNTFDCYTLLEDTNHLIPIPTGTGSSVDNSGQRQRQQQHSIQSTTTITTSSVPPPPLEPLLLRSNIEVMGNSDYEMKINDYHDLLQLPGNQVCVDCGVHTNPDWGSPALGILFCCQCSGVHR
jgi:Putative GTPase activating protein for Arf